MPLSDLMSCPPPPAPRECPAFPEYSFRVGLPHTWEVGAGQILGIQVRPGILNEPGGGHCGAVRGRTQSGTDESQWSEWVALDAGPPCVPVPEFDFTLGLTVGVLWLVASAVVAPWIGRLLRRSSRHYPVASTGCTQQGSEPPAGGGSTSR